MLSPACLFVQPAGNSLSKHHLSPGHKDIVQKQKATTAPLLVARVNLPCFFINTKNQSRERAVISRVYRQQKVNYWVFRNDV